MTPSSLGGVRVAIVGMLWTIVTAASLPVDADESPLPAGVKVVWDLEQAQRDVTPTRERICINGLWRWQPATDGRDHVPESDWGYFKVPGCWPGITDYMQQDCQTLYVHPTWQQAKLSEMVAAWHQRQITIPAEWAGRRITIGTEYLNSCAVVFVDGKRAGEMRFPAGEVDVTTLCQPGAKHILSMYVVALPLKAVMMSFSDTATPKQAPGSVARRGLCGDVYLVSTPAAARIRDFRVDTSVRKGQITWTAALQDLDASARYSLRAEISQQGRNIAAFTSKPFQADALHDGRIALTENWMPEKLWDIHTPQHQYQATIALLNADGKAIDISYPQSFGCREFWIDGRDFYLNGTRIFLSALPLDNAQIGAAWASYDGAKESLRRLKSIGINFVYTHNYGCEPGTHLGFAEILKACDDVGMLVAFSQPHFGQYDWQAGDADQHNGYTQHAEFYTGVAGSHPSVVMYSMSHNATGYAEDMNPDMMDGLPENGAGDPWALNNIRCALRAEAIVQRLDPARIVYHHSSGNLSSMHTVNFYTNMAPLQELDDWFEHWATSGVKPVFTCEYMVPCTWDWTMYRGWYKGTREFGSAAVPWEFCIAEWSSQFLGDRAYQISEAEQKNIRWEAEQFRAGRLWHRWDYPYPVGSRVFENQHTIIGQYLRSNWRAFRTWGVSAISPWEHDFFWTLGPGVDKSRKQLQVDWDRLQRPGFSPDYIERQYERMDLAFEQSDWLPTADGQAILRNNRPLLAYIAGQPAAFTSKDHNFIPGQMIEKQLLIINNSRQSITCDCQWSFGLPQPVSGARQITLATGQQQRIALTWELPSATPPGSYGLSATFRFSNGETQTDSFTVHVLPRPAALGTDATVALFDPQGQTAKLLSAMGIRCQSIDATVDLSRFEILVLGKAALTLDGPAPDLGAVRNGLKVIVFEQTPEVLEQRLGFRIAEYGLRQVFQRVPDHPILAGLDSEHLRDWRGQATLLPPRLDYELSPRFAGAPAVKWCNLEVSRVWRCGNRGNIASALLEKPACGDFLPILDGGYSLQYSPLMEYREGKGMVLFCQMDVTGRTEEDPAAAQLVRNIFSYASHPSVRPAPSRQAVYVGDPAGRQHLQVSGIALASYEGDKLSSDQVLVVGPDAHKTLENNAAAIADFVQSGGHLLALGLDRQQASVFLPFKIGMNQAEHIAAYFDPPSSHSLLAGIAPADVHNRDPRQIPLIVSGATILGNGVLAQQANVVFCQLPPDIFDNTQQKQLNVRRTYRRAAFLLTRILGNMGVRSDTPLLSRFSQPAVEDQRQSAASVLRNGDFSQGPAQESVPDQWQLSAESDQATCTRQTTGPDGKPALRLALADTDTDTDTDTDSDTDSDTDTDASIMLAQYDVPVKEGQWYRISLQAKTEGAAGKAVSLALQNTQTWESFIGYSSFAPGKDWRRFQFLVQSDGTADSNTRFQIWHGNRGVLWLADIAMVPVTPPTTEGRWSQGLYLDQPEEWDDPYRFFRW